MYLLHQPTAIQTSCFMGCSLRLTSGANKGKIQWVEEENDVFLSYVVREFHLKMKELRSVTLRKILVVIH